MTHAPASRARADVSSDEPSSTTMISRHGAAPRRADTTSPMASAPFVAGITIDTCEGSAKKTLDDSIPRDRLRNGSTGLAKPCGERAVGCKPVDGDGHRGRIRTADETVGSVLHELERPAGVGRGDHRPAGK